MQHEHDRYLGFSRVCLPLLKAENIEPDPRNNNFGFRHLLLCDIWLFIANPRYSINLSGNLDT